MSGADIETYTVEYGDGLKAYFDQYDYDEAVEFADSVSGKVIMNKFVLSDSELVYEAEEEA